MTESGIGNGKDMAGIANICGSDAAEGNVPSVKKKWNFASEEELNKILMKIMEFNDEEYEFDDEE